MSDQRSIPIQLEETDIPELLRTALRPLMVQATRLRIDLRIAVLDQVPRLRVDREKVAWSVAALVGNALRYERSDDVGGSVVVHVAHDADTDSLAISVQDDGPGIPDDKIPFLFERRRGAVIADGLALSLVRQIVAVHGGRIDVETRREPDDHGTSIAIVLPVRG